MACLVGIVAVLGVGCWALTTQSCSEQAGPAAASPSGHHLVRTVVLLCGGAAGTSYIDVLMTQRTDPSQVSRGTTETLLSLESYTRVEALTWQDDEHLTVQYAAAPGDTHHRGPARVLGVHVTYENTATQTRT